MRLFCSLSRAARIVLWVAVLSALAGLVLGYQAGSSAATGVSHDPRSARVNVVFSSCPTARCADTATAS